MIDFHCHLDLYKNPLAVFDEIKRRNIISIHSRCAVKDVLECIEKV
jgi:Tat protein secretion system quality control protein TatD with DNase activity